MSSSRVFKPEQLKEQKVYNVNFKVLLDNTPGEKEPQQQVFIDADGFRPMFYNDSAGPRDGEYMLRGYGRDEEGHSDESGKELSDEEMLSIAEEELQRRIAEAYSKGLEEGRLAAERGLANVFKALREGLDGLRSLREKVIRESEGDLLSLSILIARKVILQEMKLDPAILSKIVSETVGCCSDLDNITIFLNPADYKLAIEDRNRLLGSAADENRITLAPDESVRLGGCQVETPTGKVDARIETQLDEIFRRCLEERGLPYEPPVDLAKPE